MIPNIAQSLKAEAMVECDPKTGQAVQLRVTAEQLLPAAEILDAAGYFLEDVSGVDVQEGFELNYHFDHVQTPGRITLRLMASHDDPKAPSLALLIPGADWHERECYDFFGVDFEGHPDLKALLLEPGTEPPLIRDAKSRIPAFELSLVYPQPEPEAADDEEAKKAAAKAKAKEKAAAKAKEKAAKADEANPESAAAKPEAATDGEQAEAETPEAKPAEADKQEGAEQ
ncbi:MAG: NADH-quinone oxidoreductase subunit C [Desulfovibrionaceae bacterium]